LNPTQKL